MPRWHVKLRSWHASGTLTLKPRWDASKLARRPRWYTGAHLANLWVVCMNPKAQYIMYVFSMLLCYICIYYVIMSLSQKMFQIQKQKKKILLYHRWNGWPKKQPNRSLFQLASAINSYQSQNIFTKTFLSEKLVIIK